MLFKVVLVLSLVQYFAVCKIESYERNNEQPAIHLEDRPMTKVFQSIQDFSLDNKGSPSANNTRSMQKGASPGSGDIKPKEDKIPTKNDAKALNGDTNPSKDSNKSSNENKTSSKDNTKPQKNNIKPPQNNPKPPKDNTNPPKDNIKSPNASTVSPNRVEDNFTNDECPGDKSLHSKSDLKYIIGYVYNELSIDANIRNKYHSKALKHRDDYLRDITQYFDNLQDSPNHFIHVVASLNQVRKELIEKNLKTIAKLLKENWGLLNSYEERNKLFMRLIKKIKKYRYMCSFNCEDESDYDEDTNLKGHIVSRRSVPNVYYCSSLEDLYNKVKQKLSEFVVMFDLEAVNRFSKEDKKYRDELENIQRDLMNKGFQRLFGTAIEILFLQDEYHHLAESLKYSTVVEQITLISNLIIQVDMEISHLFKAIEQYGEYCKSCENVSFRRSTRQVVMNDKNYEHVLNTLASEKFNETASKVEEDWNTVFKDVTEKVNKNNNIYVNTAEFEKFYKVLNDMIKRERQYLKNLESTATLLKLKDWSDLVLKLGRLLFQVRDKVREVTGLINQ